MKCPRCEGLMVRDQIFDPRGSVMRIDIWRCLNCGGTIDAYALGKHSEEEADSIGKFQAA